MGFTKIVQVTKEINKQTKTSLVVEGRYQYLELQQYITLNVHFSTKKL